MEHPALYGYPAYHQPYPAYPLAPRAETQYPQDEATARYLINFGAFQRVTGTFQTDAIAVPAHTITGNMAFYQNPFTGTNSKYRIDFSNLAGGTAYSVGLQTDCLTATTMTVWASGDAYG